MMNISRYIFLLFSLHIFIVKGVKLEVLAFAYEETSSVYTYFETEFNKYSENNNLDITLKLTILSNLNTTYSFSSYGITTDTLLKKKSYKYDLIFFDSLYIKNYEPYLLDFKEYIPKKTIEKFDQNVLNQMCIHNNRLIGFPLKLGYSVLYSNKELLDRYNKTIPKTWNELLQTSKYILEEEKKLNNTNLIGYNGLFNDAESGFCSAYEFIYSYRNTVDSPYPGFTSEEAINALGMMKKLKDEISSNSIFMSNDVFAVTKLLDQSGLFIKFWLLQKPVIEKIPFYLSVLPGHIEGISGSTMCGYNLGVKRNLSEENRKASIKVMEFFISDEFQKQLVKNDIMVSAIPEIYHDKEVCENIDCELFKSLQTVIRPINKVNNIDEYIDKFRNYIYDYLYGEETAYNALSHIDDLTKIHYISLDKNQSYTGIITLFIVYTFIGLMTFSLIFVSLENFMPFFTFLPSSFWVLSVFGSICFLSSSLTEINQITSLKCYLKIIVLCFGFTLTLTPISYRLIISLPETNKFVEYVYKHKFIYIIFFILIDILICSLFFFEGFNVEDVLGNDEMYFQRCKFANSTGYIVVFTELVYKGLLMGLVLFLAFADWNINSIYYDLRFVVGLIYVDIILLTIYLLINIIKINNYRAKFYINGSLFIVLSISNYILIYGYRLVIAFLNKKNLKSTFINNVNSKFVNNENTTMANSDQQVTEYCKTDYINNNPTIISTNNFETETKSIATNSNMHSSINSRSSKIVKKILSYHYATEINEMVDNYESSILYKIKE
ncbi:periplasmic binding protein-like II [Anaeromyces robustus]|uniref:Periplasmic binding protein-like II n=1 Tax=Anaeromyces robustus TaxID=1754192 RepID=A0A1Y1X6Q0_9FUNG|nr:periplasmic binding protein-like II [Anaeromyces robustus]|eukprot:ORX80974.1 periplasmic binding protein-like II [Anaeromyces robustus]